MTPVFLTHPKLRHGITQRLALDTPQPRALSSGPLVWFHGASAGDLLALRPTISALQMLRKDCAVSLSTITNSGHAIAQKEMPDIPLRYAPYDMPGSTERAIRLVNPSVLVLEYTEMWPALITSASRAGVKIILHNGRFAAKNVGNYKRMFWLLGNLLDHFSLLLMRDEEEAERAKALGADPGKVRITGNTKFDNLRVPGEPPPGLQELFKTLNWPTGASDALIWIWGSTHDGDEERLKPIYERLKQTHPTLKLIIAPRYTERARSIAALFGNRACLRTAARRDAEVLVVDTIGELFALYGFASLVFVGGSFSRRGGQNILEPAAHGRPVTFGPRMENFADSVQVLLGRGGTQVKDEEQLYRVTEELISRPDERHKLGALAHDAVIEVRGAAEKNARLIASVLGRR